ncbi:MAG: hypothetical protein ABI352_04960 [Candidatus Dormibacter sp.]
MATDSFLGIAETRADHLRQLSEHERALAWVTASLSEVDSEIPELELAMAVYRRLNPDAADRASSGEPAFLDTAGERVDHLRQLSANMRSLNWVNAPLSEIEAEIPDLEKAMAVFRRLMPEAADEAVGAAARGRSGRSRGSDDGNDPPSFKEYALQHLDSAAGESKHEGAGRPNGAGAQ